MWVLTLVAVGGAVWLAHAAMPDASPADLFLALASRLKIATTETAVRATALGAAATALGSVYARSRRSKRRSLLASSGVVSPFAVLDAQVASTIHDILASVSQETRLLAMDADPDVVSILDTLMEGALRVGASDIHIHPLDVKTEVTYRVHGVIEEVVSLPRAIHARIVMRLKVLARLVTFRTDRPQDGHFNLNTAVGSADIRVSVLPSSHGEKVVLRLARSGVEPPTLASLGLPTRLGDAYQDLLSRPQGLVFVTGPTGSGKTTTLYSSLGHIRHTRGGTTQIATIEDPIELDVGFLSQTQVNNEVGMTFAEGLRSILRQDPNVIMVGEIRDAETARIAIQAGMSGHFILTTVHAGSAAGVFNRLIEMGVEPFVLASASLASLGQRLVRSLCPHCRIAATLSPQDAARLDVAGLSNLSGFETATGCRRCANSGYLGRTALYEMVTVTPKIRDLINEKVPTPTLQAAAESEGTMALLRQGVERAATGVTSIQEIFRVIS
jgi:general secretion pathway protein E